MPPPGVPANAAIGPDKKRFVLHEDEAFASRYHLNSPLGALRDRQPPVYAVTGNPVLGLLSLWLFFGSRSGRLRRRHPVETSTVRLLLYQAAGRVLLPAMAGIIRIHESSVKRCYTPGGSPAGQPGEYTHRMLSGFEFILVGLAALAAGMINALAGGGTLITFPTLLAVGIPPVAANVTNTVALCPGYVGGTLGQLNDLRGQGRRMWITVPAGVVGGLVGGVLLLRTGEKLFSQLVPFLILLASILLAIQGPVRAWLLRRLEQRQGAQSIERWSWLPVGLAAIYGGYFGAGMSVIVLSALGITTDDNLTRLNALKQMIGFGTNISAAIFFAFSGPVVWVVAVVMAVGALLGGTLGGRLAGYVKPSTLRWIVVSIGVVLSVIYFVRG